MKKTTKTALLITLGALLSGALISLTLVRLDIPADTVRAAYTDGDSKFVEVNSTAVHYKDQGSGPVLVLVHGTFGSLHTWDKWTEDLKGSFRVVRMDLPAFGVTGPGNGGDYSIGGYVAFLDAFASKLGLGRFSLAGNSLGGAIAWNYALAHPEKTGNLILVDAAGYPMKKLPFVIRLGTLPVLNMIGRYCTPRVLVEKAIMDVYGDDGKITPELVDRYHTLLLREGNRAAFIREIQAPRKDNSAMLKRISARTLILWGADDRWIPAEYGERFHRDIPGSELIVYPGAGHVPMEEIPLQTARDVKRFLLR